MKEELLLSLATDGVYLVRVALAGICGFAIGVERRNRLKSAGPRTHLLVAAAAALMMIVSKYGFVDMLGIEGVSVDPSRVASNIITGITFMGAGLIFVRKREVSGVTTAAGLWATVGVGMAIGSGMYVVGVATCIMVILFQLLMHSRLRFFREPWTQSVCVKLDAAITSFSAVCEVLENEGIDIQNPKIKHEDKMLEVRFYARVPQNVSLEEIVTAISNINGVSSVEL